MIWNSIADNWNQLTSQLNSTWSRLTAEDLCAIDGRKSRLIAKLQERYGITKDEAAVQVYSWVATFVSQIDLPSANVAPHVDRNSRIK